MSNIFEKILNYFNEYNKENIRNLNPDNPIYVLNSRDTSIINKFFNNDIIRTDKKSNLFMTFIPNTSKIMVSTFCCHVTMEKIHDKFASFGLAIQGCYGINPISMVPFYYSGYEIPFTGQINEKKTDTYMTNLLDKTFLVIDNHVSIKIMNGEELVSYKPIGVNVQYIEGFGIYGKGRPKSDFLGKSDIGSKPAMGRPKPDFLGKSGIGSTPERGRPKSYLGGASMEISPLIIMTDINNNIMIFYCQYINLDSLMILLDKLECYDAIILCDSANVNIIWKERDNHNFYNKTNFIGNPSQNVINVVTFSG